MAFLIFSDAYSRNDFKETVNDKFSGLVVEHIKWKTAEALGGDLSSWKNESDRLFLEILRRYFNTEVKGGVRKDLKKKRKIWNEISSQWLAWSQSYYRQAWVELRKKGFPDLRIEEMPSGVVEDLVDCLTKEVAEMEQYPEVSQIIFKSGVK
jgi:hypothetical protein